MRWVLFFALFVRVLNAVSLTKNGELTWVLGGDNSATLTDPVVIDEGTLEVSEGDNLGSGNLSIDTATLHITGSSFSTAQPTAITGAAQLSIDSGTATFSGVISGSGSLTKTNTAATLALSANSLFTGSATVEGGTLHLTNALAALPSSAVTVEAGATFLGTGTVGSGLPDTFDNFGTVVPEGADGVLQIQGNYTQQAGSTLQIELNPSTSALLTVSGATIQPGATLILVPDAGEYASGTTYILVTGLGSGTFTTVTAPPDFQAQLLYIPFFSPSDAADVDWVAILLQVNLIPFSDLVPGGNAGEVAKALDSIDAPPGSDIAFIKGALSFMSVEQMTETMNQMQPSLYNALDLAEEGTMAAMRGTISQRLDDFQRKKCVDPKKKDLWGTYFYAHSRQDSEGTNVGFTTQTQSGVGGLDYRIPERPALVGVFFGYARDRLNWFQGVGNSSIDTYCGSGYFAGMTPLDSLRALGYIRALGMASYCAFHGKRNIVFPSTEQVSSFTRTARHSIQGWSALGDFELGLMFSKRSIEFHPFGKVDYTFVHRLPFTERGADSIDLVVQPHDANLLRSELGLKILSCFRARSDSRWMPNAKLSWVFEKRFTGKFSKASFIVGGLPMTVVGISPTRNLLAYGVGLDCRGWSDHLYLGAQFEGEWSTQYHNYTFEAQVKLGF